MLVVAVASSLTGAGAPDPRAPGAAHAGGRTAFAGPPAALVAARSTLTGEHLAAYVGG